MAVSIYQGRRYDPKRFMRVMIGLNVVVAVLIIFAWQFLGWIVAEPISAAAELPLAGSASPDLLEYPFVLLWSAPLAASALGWFFYRFEYKAFGRFLVVYPLMLFVMSWGWFNFFQDYGF